MGDNSNSMFKCSLCKSEFYKLRLLQAHERRIHKIYKRKQGQPISIEQKGDNGIKCIECNCTFSFVHQLRKHLSEKHKLNMNEIVFRFPNMAAFKKWKREVERRDIASFTMRHGARKTARGQKYFYMCHRSGKYESRVTVPRKRMLKGPGTCKLGIVCTAAMYCEERENEVVVRYCPHHYGHGRETSFVQLSAEEQVAIQENVSNGIPFENLLETIRDTQSTTDHHQLGLLKRRDIRFINNAYSADVYNPGVSDAESVDRWVRQCCEMEDSPVLYYRQSELGTSEEEFVLIIMTEFQKQILLSADRQVVCVDSLYRRKGGRFYLTVLFIMDEYEKAFPVAFCVSNRVDRAVVRQFFASVRESTGPLAFAYFLSDSEDFYYDSWCEAMGDVPRWLWSMWYVDNRIRVQLRVFKGNIGRRAEVYKTMRMLLECQNENVFQSMFKNYIDSLQQDPASKTLGNFIMQKYGNNAEMWAYCHRRDIRLSTNIHLEVMHRTFRYCCREGRKKRLDKFIFVIMKLVRYKMLDRLTNVLDGEKIQLAVEAIDMCHALGLEVPSECISSLSDKIWLIRADDAAEGEGGEHVYVTREFESCPEHCDLRCSECDVCVHMYSCSCLPSLINANLCQHIHAVVWKFLTPHFSPPPSPDPAPDDGEGGGVGAEEDHVAAAPSTAPAPRRKHQDDFLEGVLRKTHDLYKKVRANKCRLSRPALATIAKKLGECLDVCDGKLEEEPRPGAKGQPPLAKSNVLVLNTLGANQQLQQQPLILPTHFQPILPNNIVTAAGAQPRFLLVVPNSAPQVLPAGAARAQIPSLARGLRPIQSPRAQAPRRKTPAGSSKLVSR